MPDGRVQDADADRARRLAGLLAQAVEVLHELRNEFRPRGRFANSATAAAMDGPHRRAGDQYKTTSLHPRQLHQRTLAAAFRRLLSETYADASASPKTPHPQPRPRPQRFRYRFDPESRASPPALPNDCDDAPGRRPMSPSNLVDAGHPMTSNPSGTGDRRRPTRAGRQDLLCRPPPTHVKVSSRPTRPLPDAKAIRRPAEGTGPFSFE